jgi:hypothetical protein
MFVWVGLVYSVYRFSKELLGTLVAALAVVVLLTRIDLEFFALRGVVDIWFLFFVFAAAAVEVRTPRRGWPIMALLALAGLIRPEAWVLSGAYVLWLLPEKRLRGIWPYVLLALSAPVVWVLWDWIVTGQPLYSLTSTRETAGAFKRNRGLFEAIKVIPDFVGANEKVINVAVGGLGAVTALWMLRRRALLPLAMMLVGLATFLLIAVAGLSVIARYMAVPSILFNLGVAVAFTAWIFVRSPRRLHRLLVGLAIVSLGLLGWRTVSYKNDLFKLHSQEVFVKEQHDHLKAILDDPKVVPLLAACHPVTVPTHSAIPVIRFHTGLSKYAIRASIAEKRPPTHGTLLISSSFNFEPSAARAVSGITERSARKWWSNYPLSTFRPVTGNGWWRVYQRC